MVRVLDPVVADLVCGCDLDGHGICDWTCRLTHMYIELRSAWHDAGGRVCDLPGLRLTADARLLNPEVENVQQRTRP